ncbi:hypothetical protein [Leifsonia aquatica]|uniref:hypothetical protein n=1 Tax=Leifsonia aquatica TaxID=144185 RepID=UPI0013B3BAB9|nr:hypothetical protein [Leifsonia aquatica]
MTQVVDMNEEFFAVVAEGFPELLVDLNATVVAANSLAGKLSQVPDDMLRSAILMAVRGFSQAQARSLFAMVAGIYAIWLETRCGPEALAYHSSRLRAIIVTSRSIVDRMQ